MMLFYIILGEKGRAAPSPPPPPPKSAPVLNYRKQVAECTVEQMFAVFHFFWWKANFSLFIERQIGDKN